MREGVLKGLRPRNAFAIFWHLFLILLRLTKWNASLILLRDYAELVALCKVIVWKTHIPVRTQKWPPLLIFAGARHGIVINHVTA